MSEAITGDLFADQAPQQAPHDPGGRSYYRLPPGVIGSAEFSPCGRYRYKLRRSWPRLGGRGSVLMLMMNPSTADAEIFDDPTVAKCGRLARHWGMSSLYVGNVCAYRATDNRRLLEIEDPVGPRNHAAILEMASLVDLIVVAHGRLPDERLQEHARTICQKLRDAGYKLHVLRLLSDGTPIHPLARGKAHVSEQSIAKLWKPTQVSGVEAGG